MIKILKIEKFFFLSYLFFLGINPYKTINPFPIEISISKLISIILLLLLFFNLKNNMKFIKINVTPVFIVICYVIAASLLSYIFVKIINIKVPFSIDGRVITQQISFFSTVAVGMYFYKFLILDPFKVKKYLLYGLYFTLAFVLLQIFLGANHVWEFSGITRLSGFSGEPKGLASYLLPFIFLLFFDRKNIKYGNLIFTFTFIVFTMTYSTSAFISFTLTFIFITWFFNRSLKNFLIFIVSGFVIIFAIFNIDTLHHAIIEKILVRIQGEHLSVLTQVYIPYIETLITVEGNEGPVFEVLVNNLYTVLTGVGYGFATVYAYMYFGIYGSGFLSGDYAGFFTPNLALLNNIMDFGLIVIGYMLHIIFREIKLFYKFINREDNKEYKFMIYFVLPLTISNFLVFSNQFKIVPLLFIALALKSIRLKSKKFKSVK